MNNRTTDRFRVGEMEFACRLTNYVSHKTLWYRKFHQNQWCREPGRPVLSRKYCGEIFKLFFLS